MKRLTVRDAKGRACIEKQRENDETYIFIENSYYVRGDASDRLAAYEDTGLLPEEIKEDMPDVRKIEEKLAGYEDAEANGLLVRLPKNISQIVKKKEAESNMLVDELIKSMRPYAGDDRLFNAVDAIRVFIAHQNEFLNTLICEEAESALAKEG